MSAPRSRSLPAWLRNFPSGEVRDLDPRRHALIEASAGTGKTFAIEHLVLRLLMENAGWNPEDVLLVSFTDKTAADLRRRVRDLFRLQVHGPDPDSDKRPIEGWSPAERERLHDLWMHADSLSIHTLHGFCQSSLRRDPLEGNALIRDEVAEDRGLADEALENLLRGPWARDPERLAGLREALDISGKESWRGKLIALALAWHPWRKDVLDPAPGLAVVPGLRSLIAEACDRLRDALAGVNAGSLPIADYAARLPGKNPESHPFLRAARHIGDCTGDEALLEAMVATFHGKEVRDPNYIGKTKVAKQGFASALEGVRGRDTASLPEWIELASACSGSLELGKRVVRERALDALRLRASAVAELRDELRREKLRRGVISYDDMPANLVTAMRGNPALAARIRRRYKACIVDEFQDTDPVQWEILDRLCLRGVPGGSEAGGEPPLPLFLVGDPKQAIYGFRGGDLRTYLAARAVFRNMAVEGRAQGFGLDANYRSRRTLIEALNATFEHSEWFGIAAQSDDDSAWRLSPGSEDVSFTPARAGKEDAASEPRVVLRETSADLGIDPSDPDARPRKADADRAVRRWIAARVVSLIDTGGRKPGDIAVLVRKNSEGEALERLLRARGIPCRARRRGGVFTGPAADALRLLLEWIGDASDPDAQARILLLPFARAGAADLPRGRPTRCPPLIARWASLARAGRWPEFFDSVRRDGGYRDRLAERSPSAADRFDRLAHALADFGSAPGTPLRAVRDRFDALRREDAGGGESADPSGEGAVSVMTLHMSKGLEFPVVFLAASGEGTASGHYVLRPPGEEGFRIVLDKEDPEAKAAHAAQALGENKRLFYVALTRAKDALHVPLLPAKFAQGSSGPLGGFAARALRDAAEAGPTRALFRFDADPVLDAPMRTAAAGAETGSGGDAPDRNALLAASKDAFARARRLTSYSGLARRVVPDRHAPAAIEPLFGEASEEILAEDGSRARREEIPAADAAEELAAHAESVATDALEAAAGISADELPPGADTGTALHAVLEGTSFATVLEAEDPETWLAMPGNRERIEEALRRESVDPAFAPAAARAVWNALRAPLPDPAGGPPLRLADFPGEDLRHEVEFLLDFPGSGAPTRDERRRGSFLWGFIDLVFRRDGRYYLLDWKSNLLPAYDDAAVARSMREHRYDLQWKLYSVALHKWLESRLPDYDPEAHFGGVLYLYLRGATPDRFAGFSARPGPALLTTEFPAEIARILEDPEEAA